MPCAWFCVAVSVFPLLASPALGSLCGPKEYRLSASQCCKKCSPGEEMVKRCTSQTETQCGPCDPGYYSRDYNEDSFCTACTICDKDRGLQEVKKCEKIADTVCTCLPGYMPDPQKDKMSCNRCRSGHFSKGGNAMCQPWTNCTARGRKQLREGRMDEDVICDDQPSVSPRITVATTLRSMLNVRPTTTPGAPVTGVQEKPQRANNWGFLMILLICAAVVLGMGGSVLCLLKNRKSSYRIPIQEEQVDYKSSLVRN